jgi:hypothetical protein
MLANLKTSNPEAPPQFRDAAILLRKWHAGMAPAPRPIRQACASRAFSSV